jgi:hypothetical protein
MNRSRHERNIASGPTKVEFGRPRESQARAVARDQDGPAEAFRHKRLRQGIAMKLGDACAFCYVEGQVIILTHKTRESRLRQSWKRPRAE